MTNFGLLAPFRRAHRDSVVSKVARRICFKIMHMFMWIYDGAKDTLLNSERMMIFVTKPIHFSKICIILSSLPHLGVDLLPANFVGFVDSICTVYEPRRPICLFSEALGNGCNCRSLSRISAASHTRFVANTAATRRQFTIINFSVE